MIITLSEFRTRFPWFPAPLNGLGSDSHLTALLIDMATELNRLLGTDYDEAITLVPANIQSAAYRCSFMLFQYEVAISNNQEPTGSIGLIYDRTVTNLTSNRVILSENKNGGIFY